MLKSDLRTDCKIIFLVTFVPSNKMVPPLANEAAFSSCFSLSLMHIKSNFYSLLLNENKSLVLDGAIRFDLLRSLCSPSVLRDSSNTLVSPAPITY